MTPPDAPLRASPHSTHSLGSLALRFVVLLLVAVTLLALAWS